MDSPNTSSTTYKIHWFPFTLTILGALVVCAFVFCIVGLYISQRYDIDGNKALVQSLLKQRDSLRSELYDCQFEMKGMDIQNIKDGK